MLILLVTQVGLDGTSVHTHICQIVAGGVTQHMGMGREVKFSLLA